MSRAGSQVMKSGRSGARSIGGGDGEEVGGGVMGPMEGVGAAVEEGRTGLVGVVDEADGETRSIMRAILSSSSGQMSGQWVNPKYT